MASGLTGKRPPGRRADPVWDFVTRSDDQKKFKCNYCEKLINGGVTEVKKHISAGCESVIPPEVREIALRVRKKKRKKPSPVAGSSSSPSDHITELILRYFLKKNIAIEDISDPDLSMVLSTIAEGGVASIANLKIPRLISNSLNSFENSVKAAIFNIKGTWKTTGCTLFFYQLNGQVVPAIYSPAGLIFLEVRINSEKGYYSYDDVCLALETHWLRISLPEDVTKIILHNPTNFSRCDHQTTELHNDPNNPLSLPLPGPLTVPVTLPLPGPDPVLNPAMVPVQDEGIDEEGDRDDEDDEDDEDEDDSAVCNFISKLAEQNLLLVCIQNSIESFCKKMFESSSWVEDLIKTSEEIVQHILGSEMLSRRFHYSLNELEVQPALKGRYTRLLFRVGVVIELVTELRVWYHELSGTEQNAFYEKQQRIAQAIKLNDFKFNGNVLVQGLHPFLRIPTLMDSLIPTAGYLDSALHEAESALRSCYQAGAGEFQVIWNIYNQWRKDEIDTTLESAVVFLSPSYIERRSLQWGVKLTAGIRNTLISLVAENEEELDAELKVYDSESHNPFSGISKSECENNHPVVLWEKYASEFPLLKRCAYKMLSQPVSCLSQQIEKQVSKIDKGDENYILRLNAMMIEEFRKMGNTYKPILNGNQ